MSLGGDEKLRVEPLRELAGQRFDLVTQENIKVAPKFRTPGGGCR